ncbi:RHS repeat domain-containing protein [Bdellovibrio sp. BCCA]|uniref:RHS repeat domain-containing protein n=1 Tax=Bdellovibrio sp. BCCA TaxID=3136281 RepID=UPI0030F2463E
MTLTKIMSFLFIAVISASALADDAWLTCVDSKVNFCSSQGYTYKIFLCDDWVGEDEVCVRCFNSGNPVYFFGCDGPGYSSLPTNIRATSAPSCQPGHSVINQTSNTFSESIPIVGSDVSLVFSSDRGLRRTDNYRLRLPLYETPPTSISVFDIKIQIAGRNISLSLPTSTNDHLDWVWDGLNNLAQPTPGGAVANIKVYFGTYSPSSVPLEFSLPLGNWKVDRLGLGGWSLSNNHFYDIEVGRLYLGGGAVFEADYEDLGGGNVAVSLDSNSEIYVFNSQGRHLQTWAALTGQVLYTFSYDSLGRITGFTDAYGRTTSIIRSAGQFTGIQTPYGVVTTASINGNGYLASITNPNSEVYSMTYTTSGMLYTFTKPEGEVTTFYSDSDGNLSKDAHSGGAFLNYLESLLASSKMYVRTSAMGREQNIEVLNSMTATTTKIVNSLGSVTTLKETYGPTGKVVRTKGDTKLDISYTYDPRFGDLVRQPSGIIQKMGTLNRSATFSHSASLSDVNDPFSIITLNTQQTVNSRTYGNVFSGSSKTWTNTTPEGRTTALAVDIFQKPTSIQIGNLTPLALQYDSWGRLVSTTQGSRTTEYTYDSKGFVAQVKNALLQITSYGYDLAGRVTTVTLPDNRVIAYAYDGNGRVTSITPPGRPQHNFFYSALETFRKYLPPILGGISKPTEYSYNNDKQVTRADRPDGVSVYFNYGSLTGVLDSISVSTGSLFEFTYETTKGLLTTSKSYDGLKNTFSYQGSLLTDDVLTNAVSGVQIGKLSLSYDNNFWVTGSSVQGASGSPLTITFGRDNDGLITSAGAAVYTYQTATPLLSTMTLGGSVENFSYNSFGELSGRSVSYSSNPIYGVVYTRDSLGRVITKQETLKGTTDTYAYSYDLSGRLTDITKNGSAYAHFIFDNNGNRTGGNVGIVNTTATYDNQDRILTYNQYTFSHNDNGEMISRQNTSTGMATNYQYNSLGALTQVTLPSGDIISYVYDGLGRRVGRKKNGITTSTYLYDGKYNIVGEIDSAGNITTQYVYVSNRHSPDFMIKNGITYKLVKDHLGSVRLVMRISDGAIVQRIDYNIFGTVTLDSNTCFQPFGFAGGLRDQDTKLLHFGARDYDPEIGRWTSKDPILFNGGDTNLYSYTQSDPVNWIDPTGLKIYDPDGIIPAWIKNTPIYR